MFFNKTQNGKTRQLVNGMKQEESFGFVKINSDNNTENMRMQNETTNYAQPAPLHYQIRANPMAI